jgi:hypothetical protein
VAEQFGLNDDLLEQFGLDDSNVGQSSQTKPPIAPGQKAVAEAGKQPYITPLMQEAAGSPFNPLGTLIARGLTGYTSNSAEAAQAGVDVSTGAPASVQAMASFADSPEQKMSIVAEKLGQVYKQKVQVREGPQSKELEFLDPANQKWTTVKGSNAARRAAGLAGATPEFVGQTVGGVGGALAGGATPLGPAGAVAGSVVGSGLGGAAGRYGKIKIGQSFGAIPQNFPVGSDVLQAGAEAAAWDLGGMAVLGGAKYARYWFKGSRAFSAKEAAALGEAAAKADKDIAEIEAATGRSFRPPLGQKISGTDAAETEAGQKALAYEAALKGKNSDQSNKLMALQAENEGTLTSYIDASNDPIVMQAVMDGKQVSLSRAQAGEDIGDAITNLFNSTIDAARKLTSQLPKGVPASETGRIQRGALAAANKEVKQTIEDPAWAAYRDGYGYDPKTFSSEVKIPWNDDARALMSSWDHRSRSAILKAIESDNSGLKLLFKKSPDKTEIVVDAAGLPSSVKTTKGALQEVDLASLDDTIHWLRNDGRKALNGLVQAGYSERDLLKLTDSLVNMRNNFLKNDRPELFDLLQTAEAATKMRKTKFEQGIIGDMLVKEGADTFRMMDKRVAYNIITKDDDTAAKEFAELARGNPEANLQTKHMMYSLYRRAVVDPETGAPSSKAHAEFMDQYGQVMKHFFTPEDYGRLNRIGGMGTVIAEQEKVVRTILPRVKEMLGGDLEVDAASLAKRTANMTPKQLGTITQLLRPLPDGDHLIKQWQSATLDGIAQKIIDKDGKVNITQLSNFLRGDQREVVKKLLDATDTKKGEKYMDNLETALRAAQMIRSQGSGSLEPQTRGLVVRMARLMFGQFTPEARVVTFGQGMRTRQVPGHIYNALTDPAELDRLAKQSEKLMKQINLATFSAAVVPYLSDSNY